MNRMRRIAIAALAAAAAFAAPGVSGAAAQSPVATGEAAWSLLKQSGSVALIRHGRTSGGAGDPPGFMLENCGTQRNLTEEGRAQAKALGEAVRAHGVAVAAVLSSRWCRCLETARLAFGAAEPWPALDNLFGNSARAPAQTAELRKRIRAWAGPGTLVMVSHGVNILPLTGIQPAEGELLVLLPDPSVDFRVVGRIATGG